VTRHAFSGVMSGRPAGGKAERVDVGVKDGIEEGVGDVVVVGMVNLSLVADGLMDGGAKSKVVPMPSAAGEQAARRMRAAEKMIHR
jgi:hypothetical protein